jgi:hypothetical protein
MNSDNQSGIWQRLVRPLASRKVRIALATVIAAFAAEFGLNVGSELVLTILGVGISLILGIAHEDAGRWSSGNGNEKKPNTE